jgi:hypothetical protein
MQHPERLERLQEGPDDPKAGRLMGSHKRTHCQKGHELTENNTCRNSEGYRECRRCKQARKYAMRQKIRKEAA